MLSNMHAEYVRIMIITLK